MHALILAAVILSYFAFPNHFFITGCWPLGWLALVFLFPAFANKSLMPRCAVGGLYGLVFYGLLVHWFVPYSLMGFLVFVLVLCLQPLLFALGYGWRPTRPAREVLYVAALWVVTEYLRAFVMSGFSWNLAYSQAYEPCMIQIAALTGSWGLAFSMAAGNFCLYKFFTSRKSGYIFAVLFLIGGVYIVGQARLTLEQDRRETGPTLEVLAVQPNIDFRQKNDISYLGSVISGTMASTYQGLKRFEPDLIVWPETAWPVDYRRYDGLFAPLRRLVAQSQNYFLFGTVEDAGGRDFNSAVMLGPDTSVEGHYQKRYLVPFSEYLPSGILWSGVCDWLKIRSHDFHPGQESRLFEVLPEWGREPAFVFRFGLLICSEDTLGFLYRAYKSKGAGLIIVLLNDGWFSKKEALMLHAQNAILHAVENGIPVLRVANNGWTGYIDALGRIGAPDQVALQKAGFGRFRVQQGLQATMYSLCGDWFCYLSIGFVIIILLEKLTKNLRQPESN